MSHKARRHFLKLSGTALLTVPFANLSAGNAAVINDFANIPYKEKKHYQLKLNVKDFGAKADGSMKDTFAFQSAIDRCSVLGGGEIIVPEGKYLIGAIELRSNTTLILEKGSVLTGSSDLADYPVRQVRWEGKWISGYTALVFAADAENIAIIGKGQIRGSYDIGGRPNERNPYRRPALIEPINCRNLHFEGFSTDYHLMWSIHPTYCENIFIKGLTIRSTGGNGDGIDIDSCKNVKIDQCDIATGDDCISLKSGRGMEGYSLLRTTENVHITNCTFADSIFACIGIGSETSGGIRNVKIEDCKFTHAKTHAIYIKSRPGRGAFIENIEVKNIEVSGMEGGFLRFNILGSGIQDQNPVPGLEGIPTIKNFKFSNIKVVDVPVLVEGTAIHADKPLNGFLLSNISGTCVKGISLANIQNARLKDIHVKCKEGALLNIVNVKGEGLQGAEVISQPKLPEPVSSNNNYKFQ